MNRVCCLIGVLVAMGLVVAARPQRSEACSPPPPVWVLEPAGVPITGVPVQGVVPVFSQNDPAAADQIRVTVRDASEVVVAGSLEVRPWRLVWRSDAPLEASTTYTMLVEDDWGATSVEVPFVTAAEDAPMPPAPSLAGSVWLGEEVRVVEQYCCGTGEWDTCGGQELEACWAQSHEYLPRLSIVLGVDDEARRWSIFSVEASGAQVSEALEQVGAQGAEAVWGARQATYCATVTATSLLDGSGVSEERCASDGELVPAERAQPEEPDESQCSPPDDYQEPPWDDDDWEENEDWKSGDGNGCAAGGTKGGAGGALALLLTVLPLAARRARRRRGG